MLRTVIALCVGLLLLSAPANAATIVNRGGTLTYTGSRNQDQLELRSYGSTVRLAGPATLHGRGCTTNDSGAAVCRRVKTVVVSTRAGDDRVDSSLLIPAVILGGTGADDLAAGGGPTELRGGAGNDGLSGSDRTVFRGGPGMDSANVRGRSPLAVRVHVPPDVEDVSAMPRSVLGRPSGTATLTGSDGPNHLSTWLGDDTIVGGAGRDVVDSGDGDDTIDVRDGEADRVICGSGDDTVLADAVDQVADSCDQAQVPPPASASPATLVNRDGTLTYTGGSAVNPVISTTLGIGRSQTPGYDVRVTRSAPHDPLTVDGCVATKYAYECAGVTAVVVVGGPGPDHVSLSVSGTVSGGAGDDELSADGGGSIDGGPGEDALYPTRGETVSGGTGIDTVFLRRSELKPLTATLDGTADDGLAGEANDVLADVEDVVTGPFYDRHDYTPDAGPATITGSDAANHLYGSYGDDVITGGKGRDELNGEDGDDRLDARDGEADRVDCGPGKDVALVDRADLVSSNCERIVRTQPS